MQIPEIAANGQLAESDMPHSTTDLSAELLKQDTGDYVAASSSCHEQGCIDPSQPTAERQDDHQMPFSYESGCHDSNSSHGSVWRLGQSCTIYDMSVLVPELQKKLQQLAHMSEPMLEPTAKTKIRLDCASLQELDAAGVQLFLSLAKTLSPNKLELYWPNIPDAFAWFVNFIAQHQHHVDLVTTYGADDV